MCNCSFPPYPIQPILTLAGIVLGLVGGFLIGYVTGITKPNKARLIKLEDKK